MDKNSLPVNCEKLVVPRFNAEISDKLDNETKNYEIFSGTPQKTGGESLLINDDR